MCAARTSSSRAAAETGTLPSRSASTTLGTKDEWRSSIDLNERCSAAMSASEARAAAAISSPAASSVATPL